MNAADAQAHPWPSEGKLIDFRFRRAVWVECGPMYNQKGEDWQLADLIRVILMRGIYPFLTWNLGTILGRECKGYVGFKPINPKADPAFFWRELAFVQKAMAEDALFVQLSVRGATAAGLVLAALAAAIAVMW